MTKYEEYFNRMVAENEDKFSEFREVHDAYAEDPTLQDEYNDVGKPILDIIREYEDKLCNRSEGSGYGAYAGNLADKFWSLVRQEYPMIDRVGVIIRKAPVVDVQEPEAVEITKVAEVDEVDDFSLKKIEVFEVRKINLN